MPPRRDKKVRHSLGAGAGASDIDSDHAVTAPSDAPTKTDEDLNLAVLKRYHPDIASIVYIATYAVIYIFSPVTSSWEKANIEGSAFICVLQPTTDLPFRFALVVLNRRGLKNFIVEIAGEQDVEFTEGYTIFRMAEDGAEQVYGLWIFAEPPPSSTASQRELATSVLQECLEKVEEGKRIVEQASQMESMHEPPRPVFVQSADTAFFR